MTTSFDLIDRKILDLLQRRDRPVSEIADEVGLSQTPCWRRIRRMEEAGVIRKRVTLVDPKKAGVPMIVFIAITAPRHEMAWLVRFRELIENIPQIVEAYRLTGTVDYILKVMVPDVEAFDQVYKSMIEQLEFSQINSSISMEELKFTTAVPTNYL
ncbi:ArsR family transcriptional regulator [Rhizobium sp. KAs_5_22]|uniref:Lrp/AsnC family transcriptional regulator n=1 Tax=Ciceribacter selenitireducens TaxID=448181 RepID=UPI0004B7E338|nr:Lrp/AsnC family transcriptional regulator [Ciceribacter selenitireducens]PPJ49091.1 ArsR family transcriptional regulator [Rhizobium sp. KAs_5_22]